MLGQESELLGVRIVQVRLSFVRLAHGVLHAQLSAAADHEIILLFNHHGHHKALSSHVNVAHSRLGCGLGSDGRVAADGARLSLDDVAAHLRKHLLVHGVAVRRVRAAGQPHVELLGVAAATVHATASFASAADQRAHLELAQLLRILHCLEA